MTSLFRNNFIYTVVGVISLLLLADILVTYRNNQIIRDNRALQHEAETIKLFTEQIGKSTIHGIDIGLRGYALVRNDQFFSPVDSAFLRKDSILTNIEIRLVNQGYQELPEFYALKDSLSNYFKYCFYLKTLLDNKKDDEFMQHFQSDKGLYLWLQYLQCQRNIAAFEDQINNEAQQSYDAAMRGNSILQIVLFMICVPTLLYTAFHTRKTMALSELLRQTDAEKNKLLTEQNTMLEKMVAQRTKEILARNEEMQTQSDVLASQNTKLQEAQLTIEKQKQQLEIEVDARTQDLKHANTELLQQNNQLEQFAFISAHNLRAPLARIMGLANILNYSHDADERNSIIAKMISATGDLDHVIRDLNTILDIRKHNSNLQEVNLHETLNRVMKGLEREIEITSTQVTADLSKAGYITGIAPYVESIFYNLLSNAIKYRHPERSPVVTITTAQHDDHILLTVSDNGLGIDLEKHKNNIFGLYKRFHLHMEGRGLGLYLIKTQLASMGGTIDLKSEPEVGTSFQLFFKK